MKKWTVVLVMMMAVAPMARADDASKTAKVHELFTAMHMDRMMSQMMDQMTGFMKQQFQQSIQEATSSAAMSDGQKKLTDEFFGKVMKLATDSMSWKALEPEYTKIYANTYTEDEIDAITVFYKSPAGQAMLTKTPELTAASMKVVQGRMVELQPKMKELSDQYAQQMKAYSTPK
jgi:hypothetical protein